MSFDVAVRDGTAVGPDKNRVGQGHVWDEHG